MPNWCDNWLAVTGPTEDVTRFMDAARDGNKLLSLEKLRPIRSGSRDESEVRQEKWGTSWEISDVRTDALPEGVLYWYTTGWTPISDQCLATISRKHPSLKFALDYEEPGSDFKGGCTVVKGKILITWRRPLSHAEHYPAGCDDDDCRECPRYLYQQRSKHHVDTAAAIARGRRQG